MSDYQCVLPFDTDDKQFRRGVEVGIVWEALKHGQRSFMVHADNTEMLMRIGESLDLAFTAFEPCDEWVHVDYKKRGAE